MVVPGLGKTHLVQAIGNALLQNNPRMKILYTPISSFYSEFIKSLQNKKSDAFREKYRKLDVLIIDDFQMIMNKDASQVEFFDIFNELYGLNKQIIVTSDRLPDQIKSVDAGCPQDFRSREHMIYSCHNSRIGVRF